MALGRPRPGEAEVAVRGFGTGRAAGTGMGAVALAGLAVAVVAGCSGGDKTLTGAGASVAPTAVGDFSRPAGAPTATTSAAPVTIQPVPPSPVLGSLVVAPVRGAVGDPVEIVANCPGKGTATLYSGPFSSTGGTIVDGKITYKTDATGQVVVKTVVGPASAGATLAAGPDPVDMLCTPDSSTGKSIQLLGIPGTFFYVLG